MIVKVTKKEGKVGGKRENMIPTLQISNEGSKRLSNLPTVIRLIGDRVRFLCPFCQKLKPM